MPTATSDDMAREHEDGSPEKRREELYGSALKASREGDINALEATLAQWRSDRSLLGPRVEEELGWMLLGAADHGQAHVARYLLDQGAQVDSDVSMYAATHGSTTEVWQAFVDHGWDINSLATTGWPVLVYVFHHDPILHWFLDHGVDVNQAGPGNLRVLDQAALKCDEASVRLLLQRGAKLELSSALQTVAYARHTGAKYISMMAFLLDQGADINARKHQGDPEYFERVKDKEALGTALHYAARRGHGDRVRFLLDRGADPNIPDTAGRLPVDTICERDETGILDLLGSCTKPRTGDALSS